MLTLIYTVYATIKKGCDAHSLTTFVALLVAGHILTGCSNAPPAPPVQTSDNTETSETLDLSTLNPNQQSQYENAVKLLANGNADNAEHIFESLSQAKPEFAGTWANLAIIEYNRKDLESAKTLAQRGLSLNPNSAQLSNLLGRIENDQGRFKEAENYYDQAIAINSDYAIAHYNLALLYDIYYQQIDLAVVHYRRYLEITGYQDQGTESWVQQLERTISSRQ